MSKIRVFGDFGVQRAALVAPGICIHMCPVWPLVMDGTPWYGLKHIFNTYYEATPCRIIIRLVTCLTGYKNFTEMVKLFV